MGSKEQLDGLILQSIGGFYMVEAADAVYTCRARGLFRKDNQSPVAGDRVTLRIAEDGTGVIESLQTRRNVLVRPPVANLDQLVVVASVADPSPNTLVIDKMIALAEKNGIQPIVAVTKADLKHPDELERIYRLAGLPVFAVSVWDPGSIECLKRVMWGKVAVFTGNSGVGKSSLLNRIDPRLSQETGETSKKLGRGRHTTRTTVLFRQPDGGYIADTPGFSSIEFERTQVIRKEELPGCFREFDGYFGQCRYASCTHMGEDGCALDQAVAEGKIAPSRLESYRAMYREVKDWKEWRKK